MVFSFDQELSNPLVVPHMEFYPHDPRGKNICALYQSVKWREELSRETRVQMVPWNGKHYYIFEPVTLRRPDQPIVIPIFFYQIDNELYSKCIKPKFSASPSKIRPNGCLLSVPSNIEFNSEELMEILVSNFDLLYTEIKTIKGHDFKDLCGNHMVGE